MSEEESSGRVDQTHSDTDKIGSGNERVVISKAERESLTKEEWAQKWLTMELYVDRLEEKLSSSEGSKPVNWCFFLSQKVFYKIFVLFTLFFTIDNKKK